jgi:cytochrome c553
MKYFLVIFSVLFLSCNQNKSAEENPVCEKPTEDLQMYKASEMAILMEQMYVHNKQLREKIIKKDSLGEMPNYFLNISKAKMTKGKERDDFFNTKADYFLKTQTEIYNSKNKEKSYNTMVDACISCHEVKCGGPIDRIKKLYIK